MNRIEKIVFEVKDKKVLHIGFADSPNYQHKYNSGGLLHTCIYFNTVFCVGYDIDNEAVEWLSKYFNDVYSDIGDVPLINYDYVLLGEIIEHIGNPVSFLKDIRKRFSASKFIITVPNAFKLKNFIYAMRGIERINPDHRFWFTKKTIAKVLEDAGYNNIQIYFVESYGNGVIKKILFYLFPEMKSNLFVIAEK
jgi:hypothetical protein